MIESLTILMRERLKNMDNKSGSLIRVKPEKRQSKKEGNATYYVLVLTWNMPNDEQYEQELFITSEQYQLINLTEPVKALF